MKSLVQKHDAQAAERKRAAQPARAQPRRPQHPEFGMDSLHGSWRAAEASRFGVDSLPKSVAKGVVKVNTVAFADSSTEVTLCKKAPHVVKSLGIAVPTHQRRRPARLEPLREGAAVPTYLPTEEAEAAASEM